MYSVLFLGRLYQQYLDEVDDSVDLDTFTRLLHTHQVPEDFYRIPLGEVYNFLEELYSSEREIDDEDFDYDDEYDEYDENVNDEFDELMRFMAENKDPEKTIKKFSINPKSIEASLIRIDYIENFKDKLEAYSKLEKKLKKGSEDYYEMFTQLLLDYDNYGQYRAGSQKILDSGIYLDQNDSGRLFRNILLRNYVHLEEFGKAKKFFNEYNTPNVFSEFLMAILYFKENDLEMADHHIRVIEEKFPVFKEVYRDIVFEEFECDQEDIEDVDGVIEFCKLAIVSTANFEKWLLEE